MYLVTLDMCSCDVTPRLPGAVLTKRELTVLTAQPTWTKWPRHCKFNNHRENKTPGMWRML